MDIWILHMFSYSIAVLIVVIIITTDTPMGNIIIIWACACILIFYEIVSLILSVIKGLETPKGL